MPPSFVRAHAQKGRPVRAHLRWVLPTQYSTTIVDKDKSSLEWVPTAELYGDDPAMAAFLAKDWYWEDSSSRKNIKYLADRLVRGLPIDPVEAVADASTGKIDEFNGGHRIRAAAIAGVEAIPYVVEWQVPNTDPRAGSTTGGVYYPKTITVSKPRYARLDVH